MKVLKKIDSSNVIGIDIETVRFTDTYEELDGVEPFNLDEKADELKSEKLKFVQSWNDKLTKK